VHALKAGARHLSHGRLGRRAELDGAVDVVGEDELANLLEEGPRVHRALPEEEDGAVKDERQRDDGHHEVDVHQGAALLEKLGESLHFLCLLAGAMSAAIDSGG